MIQHALNGWKDLQSGELLPGRRSVCARTDRPSSRRRHFRGIHPRTWPPQSRSPGRSWWDHWGGAFRRIAAPESTVRSNRKRSHSLARVGSLWVDGYEWLDDSNSLSLAISRKCKHNPFWLVETQLVESMLWTDWYNLVFSECVTKPQTFVQFSNLSR